MGGYGSGRWSWHNRKIQVEECLKLTIYFLKPYLQAGTNGTVQWSRGGEERASLGYGIPVGKQPVAIQLNYTINASTDHPEKITYSVKLTTTHLPWGGVRYWFICPLQGCSRRVGCLYLPPGGKYFGCRHCYDLHYESQTEWHKDKSMYANMAALMQDTHPGMNWEDMRDIFDNRYPRHWGKLTSERYRDSWWAYDRHEGYLTQDELCQQSGLTVENLKKLEAARLLVPDTQDGRYRPKLAGWGKKLAYLLGKGWTVEEIKRWSMERWKSGNPKKWPPGMDI